MRGWNYKRVLPASDVGAGSAAADGWAQLLHHLPRRRNEASLLQSDHTQSIAGTPMSVGKGETVAAMHNGGVSCQRGCAACD